MYLRALRVEVLVKVAYCDAYCGRKLQGCDSILSGHINLMWFSSWHNLTHAVMLALNNIRMDQNELYKLRIVKIYNTILKFRHSDIFVP